MSVTLAVAVLLAPADSTPSVLPAAVAVTQPVAAPEKPAGVASTAGVEAPPPAPQAVSPAAIPPAAVEPPADPAAAVAAAPAAPGDIVVTARAASPADPLASINATTFEVVQAVDDAIVAPIAHGYVKAVPSPIRSGLHNFLNNIDEPIVFLNFLLQLKPGKAVETLTRFTINSTIGIGGLIDVAKRKPFRLPRRFNGLADTLGYYGVKPGPYFFLPLIGSTTLRDAIGRLGDNLIVPAIIGNPYADPKFRLANNTLSALDDRVEIDGALKAAKESSDPYVSVREWYLKNRQAEIDVLKGKRRSVDDPRPPEPKHRHHHAEPVTAPVAP